MQVSCPHCSRKFNGSRISPRHVGSCPNWPRTLTDPCLCGFRAVSDKKLKAHKRACETWKSRDRKAHQAAQLKKTMLERHGVENPRHLEEVEAKRVETIRERYGADNVFSKESAVFGKVQASLEGKRPVFKGEDNPFAKPGVQAKIREYWLREHGVENPQQVSEIRARTSATCEARYGGMLMASEDLAEKARATNLERYGDEVPQRTDNVKERTRETNRARYGVPWTSMDPEVRAKQLEKHHERYGSHWFASDEGKEAIRVALLEKYGVDHWMKTEGAWDKVVETFRERYGVDHPLHLAEFLEKRMHTNLERYGVENVLQNAEVLARMVGTKIERYGSPWGPCPTNGPNGLEMAVLSLAPEGSLHFTGDFTFWCWLPSLSKHKNPDFIVPGPDPTNPKKGVTRVVEAFGDFWHSRIFTGKAPFEHEQELIEAYAEVGIACLVLWESEVKADPDSATSRLVEFISH
jgi:hypothetical protein